MDNTKLQFQISSWNSYNDASTDKNKYAIQMFGRTVDNKDVCIKVTDFHPYFFVKIPQSWNRVKVDNVMQKVKSLVEWKTSRDTNYEEEVSDSLVSYTVVKRKDFYGFRAGEKKQFIRLEFMCMNGFKAYRNVLSRPIRMGGYNSKQVRLQLYETKIEPFMRFMHNRDLEGCGWVSIDKKDLIDIKNYSRCDHSYMTEYDKVNPLDGVEEKVPFKILAYDIECVSCDEGMPQAIRPKDKIIQIGMTVSTYGSQEISEKYILTLGRCLQIPGVKVLCYRTEKNLIKGFFRTLNEIRPDFMSGYNTFGFDDSYIYDRMVFYDKQSAKKQGVKYDHMKNRFTDKCLTLVGKLNNEYIMETENVKQSLSEYTKKELSSAALGDNFLMFFQIPGISPFDMYKVIRRDHTTLNSYKLDDIASHFINDKIKGFEFGEEHDGYVPTKIRTDNISVLTTGSYIQILSKKFTTMPLVNDVKYQVDDITRTDGIYVIHTKLPVEAIHNYTEKKKDPKISFIWAFAKDDVHYSQINEYFRDGDPAKIAEIAKYCIKDCILVNILIQILETIMTVIGMANVSSVPFSYINIRGQGIKALSLVSRVCAKKGYLMPTLKVNEDEKYEGAVVIPPEPGIYLDPIVVLDFNSLYPNSMREINASHECIVDNPDYDDLPGYVYRNVTYTQKDSEGNNILNPDGTPKLIHTRFAQRIVTEEEIMEKLKCSIDQIRNERDHHINDINLGICDFAKYRKILEKQYQSNEEYLEKIKNADTPKKQARIIKRNRAYLIEHENKACEDAIHQEKIDNYRYDDGVWLEYGIIPEILTFLLNSRNKAKLLCAQAKDSFKKALYNVMQLSYKITANSIYGQTGAKTSSICMIAIAASTTATGRGRLYYAKKIVEDNFEGSEIIYGDTDSIFINFNVDKNKDMSLLDKVKKSMELGDQAAKLINKEIPLPQKIVYEKTICPLILEKRKKYVGLYYMDDPTKCTMKSMGNVLKRRDNAPIVKLIVGEMVTAIMEHMDLNMAIQNTRRIILDVIDNKYPINYFIMTKTLKGNYANPDSIAHNVLANRMAVRDPGNKPKANDRMNYVHIVVNDRRKDMLQGDMIETPEYVSEHGLKLDYVYYIENQIVKPASKYLGLILSKTKVERFFREFIDRARVSSLGVVNIGKYMMSDSGGSDAHETYDFMECLDNIKKIRRSSKMDKVNIGTWCTNNGVSYNYTRKKTKKKHKVSNMKISNWLE